MNIFVGNLAYGVTDRELRGAFEAYGQVSSASVIMDRATNKSRGFGFVEMREGDAQGAIQAMNGREMNGRQLRVNEAQERPPRPRSNGGPFRR